MNEYEYSRVHRGGRILRHRRLIITAANLVALAMVIVALLFAR